MITRTLATQIQSKLGSGKAIIIYGARQVGKTTLLRTLFPTSSADPFTSPLPTPTAAPKTPDPTLTSEISDTPQPSSSLPITKTSNLTPSPKIPDPATPTPDISDTSKSSTLWLNGDESSTQSLLATPSAASFRPFLQHYTTVIIDEAQRIKNIGLKLKILQDNFGDKVQFIATGSSSFDLANKINEPMTGRKWTFYLPTLTATELSTHFSPPIEQSNLETRLIYGTYPAVVTAPADARATLTELASDSLYRDVLTLGEIIKTDKLRTLLRALALQVGSQVSLTELASLVGIDRKTVDKYISLLEQSFIIFRLPSFGRNLRNELKFSQKIYFYDTGIRNAIINDFRPLELRLDTGALFENYLISELKKLHHADNLYFWRNTDGQEIDLIIEKDGTLTALEFKYNPKKSPKFPASFLNTYHPTHTEVINPSNYLSFLTSTTTTSPSIF